MAQSIVQSAISNTSGSSTVTLAFPSNNTANNGLCYILHYDDTQTLTSVSDSASNTLIQVDHQTSGNGGIYTWVVKKCKGGANTLTINFGGTLGYWFLSIFEITDSGGNTNGFDVDSHAVHIDVTGGVVPSLTLPTTTHSNTITCAGGGANSVLNGAPSSGNFTTIGHGGFYSSWYGDVILTSTGTPTATWTGTANFALAGMSLFTVTNTNNNLSVTGGTYTLTGSSITLNAGEPLSGGTYSLTGNSLTLGASPPLSGGTYSLTGSSITLNTGIPLGSGSYSYTGTSITLTHSGSTHNNLSLDSGSYSLTGTGISFVFQPSQPTTGGRQVDPDELMIASHKWHQRQLEAEYSNISAIAAELGSLGGHARAKSLTAKQRSTIATKAALTRWK